MSFLVPALLPAGTPSLPPLGGRLFVAYRIVWWVLIAIALATLAWSWIFSSAAFGIELLRTAKAIVLIAVSAILYRRRRKDPVAAMLGLAFLLWTISSSVDFAAISALPLAVDRFRFLFFALALLLFPGAEWQPRWTRHVALAIFLTFLLGLVEISELAPTRLFLPLAICCVLAALVALAERYRSLGGGAQKQQLKWVLLGLFCGIALILAARTGAALTRDMPGQFVRMIVLEGLFQLGIVVLALGFLTSLLRYRLYDAEAAISRSAIYAGLTLTLVGTFAASEALIELVGQRFFGMAVGNVSGAVAAAIAAMLLTPLHGRISDWAERHFQHDLAGLKQELPDLLAVLSTSVSTRRLAGVVLPRIGQAVHATRLALLIEGRLVATEGIEIGSARRLLRGWSAPHVSDVHDRCDEDPFPLRIALRCPLGGVRAWLLLGPRPDGTFYGRDDLDALSEIAPPLQRTLLTVAEREAENRRRRRVDAAFRRSVNDLEDRIAILERRQCRR